jgi:hypothetical protein
MSSLSRVESAGNQTGFAELSHSPGQLKFDIQGAPNFHPHSLPEYDGLNSGVHCNSPGAMAANINPRPLERIYTQQLARMSSNGNPIEFSEGGKCNEYLAEVVFYLFIFCFSDST